MKKTLLVSLLLAVVLMAVPAFAKGTISVGSTSSVQVTSWNYGNGGSFATEKAFNISSAGYTVNTCKDPSKTVSTFATSTGGTFGFAIGGYVQGFQSGYATATVTK